MRRPSPQLHHLASLTVPWAHIGAGAFVLFCTATVVASLIWPPAPLASSAITAGRAAQAALADAQLWARARSIVAWSTPWVALLLMLWVAALEGLRKPRAGAHPWAPWLILGLIWALHAVNQSIWVRVDQRPPYWDMASHLRISLQLWRATSLAEMAQVMEGVGHYPPLYYLLTLPFYSLLGISESAAVSVNLLSLALLMVATYGLGAHLWDPATGLLGAGLVSMYPMVIGLSRKYLMDVTLMAWVALSVWALVRSEGFRRGKYVLLFGLFAALGMLTKRAFALYIMGPLLWVGGEMLVSMLKKRPLEKPAREKRLLEKRTLEKRTLFQRPILYLGGAAVLLLLLAAPWYLSRAESLVAYARHRFFLGGAEGVNLVGIGRSMGYYLRSFVGQELQLAFGALFAFGLMAALWRGGRANALALAWFGGALGLVSLFSVRDARFMMPAFPAMALLSSAALMGVRGRWGRRALVALASGAAIFQLVVLSYGVGALPAPVNPSRQVAWDAPWGPLVLYSERAHISLPAQPWEWQIRHILNAIAEDGQGFGHGEGVVGVIPNRAAFEPATLAYYAEKGGLSLRVIGLGNDPGYATSAMSCHYVIAKSGDQGRPELNRFAESATQDLLAGPLQAHFETLAEYELPDRTIAYLLANLER